MLDQTKFVKKTNDYSVAVSGGVNDSVLLDIGARYEENLSRNLSALHPDEVKKRFDGVKEVLWTTKYDGKGCWFMIRIRMPLPSPLPRDGHAWDCLHWMNCPKS